MHGEFSDGTNVIVVTDGGAASTLLRSTRIGGHDELPKCDPPKESLPGIQMAAGFAIQGGLLSRRTDRAARIRLVGDASLGVEHPARSRMPKTSRDTAASLHHGCTVVSRGGVAGRSVHCVRYDGGPWWIHPRRTQPPVVPASISTTTKHIFVTGGVVSSLGKGLTAASLGSLLTARGLRVVMQKLDPYLNVDPGHDEPVPTR